SESFTAVFGAPMAQEDHARRAVLAALELRQRVHASPALREQLAGEVFALGMGLHSGLVVVGGLGQDPQRLATAVGAPVHMGDTALAAGRAWNNPTERGDLCAGTRGGAGRTL